METKAERQAARQALAAKDAEITNAAIKDKAYFAELRENLRAAGCAFSYEVGADNWNKSFMWVFGYSGEWRKFFDAKDAEIAQLRAELAKYNNQMVQDIANVINAYDVNKVTRELEEFFAEADDEEVPHDHR